MSRQGPGHSSQHNRPGSAEPSGCCDDNENDNWRQGVKGNKRTTCRKGLQQAEKATQRYKGRVAQWVDPMQELCSQLSSFSSPCFPSIPPSFPLSCLLGVGDFQSWRHLSPGMCSTLHDRHLILVRPTTQAEIAAFLLGQCRSFPNSLP